MEERMDYTTAMMVARIMFENIGAKCNHCGTVVKVNPIEVFTADEGRITGVLEGICPKCKKVVIEGGFELEKETVDSILQYAEYQAEKIEAHKEIERRQEKFIEVLKEYRTRFAKHLNN